MTTDFSRRTVLRLGGGAALASALVSPTRDAVPAALAAAGLPIEDGYDLWLRYRRVADAARLDEYRSLLHDLVRPAGSEILASAASELERGLSGLLDRRLRMVSSPERNGTVVVGTPRSSDVVRAVVPASELAAQGPEGFVIRWVRHGRQNLLLIASAGEKGALYGAFALLRVMQTHGRLTGLSMAQSPANPLRVVNHWDNLDRTVERGYAGKSIFAWDELPALDSRYTDYARALASVGINGTVVNNVNANAQFLSSDRLPGLAALAAELRRWGVTFHVSANYASPITLTANDPDPITTADPFDARVRAWWRAKVDEIYRLIPDLGGFLVKANSEGQPGPLNYGRTHADGANMMAEIVAPHGGIIMWRSFVHEGFSDWAEYQHRVFAPLDGDFADNVVVQTKNGPIDFQVREPVNPLFGAMPNTNQMLELQITQEYTGHATHLCYLVPEWKQVLEFDTRMNGPGTTVANIVSGEAYGQSAVGFAGVINFGDDRNWTGYQLGAANTHGYARLSWDPSLSAEAIAEEWVRMTFGSHPDVVGPLTDVLTRSWRTYEDYTSPLGMGYLTYPLGVHFEPDPRSTLNLSHYTDSEGTGFDRTVATGTGYTGLYHPSWAATYESLETMPDELLLFMHKVPYTHVLQSGKTVIQHIYDTHFDGLLDVDAMREIWRGMAGRVDSARHADVLATFDAHAAHAQVWRDTMVAFFFGYGRVLDERRRWLQADLGGASALLFGGWPNRLPVEVGNASPSEVEVRAVLDVPDGWRAAPAFESIGSTEFETLSVPVQPPLTAEILPLALELEPSSLEALGVTGREFVVAPAGRRCHLALDAGSSASPLVPGYERLAPETAWDPARGFGWVGSAPQSRDRGGGLDALRRDFCGNYPSHTLRISVPAGRHETVVLVGDGGPDSHPTFVSVDGQRVAETPFLAGGSFAWASFNLDGGSAGRDVDLVFDSSPDQFWHLCALAVIDSSSTLPPLVVMDVQAELAWLGGREAPVAVSVANTSDSAQAASVGVDVPQGWTVREASASIPAGTEQTLTAYVTPPVSPALATVTVRVSSGAEVGDPTRELKVVAVPSGEDVPLALDAGPATSPVLATLSRIAAEDTWDPARGYGWVGNLPDSRDRNRIDDLRRDFTLGRDAAYVLRVAVPPGAHTVHVLTGDAFAPSGTTTVRENGVDLGSSSPQVIPQGDFEWFSFPIDGGADGRTADLELVGSLRDRYWRLVSLVLQPV